MKFAFYLNMHNCGRQKEPAILFSTLLLQTHALQLYSLVLTRFCWNLKSSTTNAWNAKNAIFSRALRVTFGPWITWRSCIAAAPTNPNKACQLGFDFSSERRVNDEGLTLETSAFESLYGGQFTLSTQSIKPNYLVILHRRSTTVSLETYQWINSC